MTAIGGWHMDSGAQHVRELVLRQPRELRYLTYADYELTLPPRGGNGVQ